MPKPSERRRPRRWIIFAMNARRISTKFWNIWKRSACLTGLILIWCAGLDYYSRTVFEIYQEKNEGQSQTALGGGGRYDGLIKMLGGKETPATGGGLGVDRIVLAMKAADITVGEEKKVKVFLAQLGALGKKKCLKLFEDLRQAGISVGESFDRDSLKSQLKIADKYGAKYTLLLGQKEAIEGTDYPARYGNRQTGNPEIGHGRGRNQKTVQEITINYWSLIKG